MYRVVSKSTGSYFGKHSRLSSALDKACAANREKRNGKSDWTVRKASTEDDSYRGLPPIDPDPPEPDDTRESQLRMLRFELEQAYHLAEYNLGIPWVADAVQEALRRLSQSEVTERLVNASPTLTIEGLANDYEDYLAELNLEHDERGLEEWFGDLVFDGNNEPSDWLSYLPRIMAEVRDRQAADERGETE